MMKRSLHDMYTRMTGAAREEPTDKAEAHERCLTIFRTLRREAANPVKLPVRAHAKRLPSGERGVRLAFLCTFFFFLEEAVAAGRRKKKRQQPASWEMGDVCKGAGKPMTVCELTRSTGLSLAESVALVGARDNVRTDDLVGRATTFFSYSWTGSTLGDVLAALRRALPRLAAGGAAGGERQAVWVDMFCASQNLLAGAYRDPAITKESDPAGYAARKEDTDRVFDDAFEPVREVILYASPLCAARDSTPRAPSPSPRPPPAREASTRAPTRAGRAAQARRVGGARPPLPQRGARAGRADAADAVGAARAARAVAVNARRPAPRSRLCHRAALSHSP